MKKIFSILGTLAMLGIIGVNGGSSSVENNFALLAKQWINISVEWRKGVDMLYANGLLMLGSLFQKDPRLEVGNYQEKDPRLEAETQQPPAKGGGFNLASDNKFPKARSALSEQPNWKNSDELKATWSK